MPATARGNDIIRNDEQVLMSCHVMSNEYSLLIINIVKDHFNFIFDKYSQYLIIMLIPLHTYKYNDVSCTPDI